MPKALPSVMHNKIISDLRSGEELRWCEAPKPLAFFSGKHGFIAPILFAAFLGGAFWAIAADSGSSRWFLYVFSAFVFGSFLYQALTGFGTRYGITTRRLVILEPSISSTEITSYYPADIEFITKKKRKDGSGNIVFGAVQERGGKRTVTVPVGFFGVKDVDQVERLILELKNSQAEKP